jgi:anionic cell wall polymer biosynthesis LytR-Cps2A-Psr (LCP) family protein
VKFSRKQLIILSVVAVIGLLVSVAGTVVWSKGGFKGFGQEQNAELIEGTPDENSVAVLGASDGNYVEAEAPDDLSELNILLLGYGGAGHSGGHLTDVIQIAHFDFESKKIGLISIPRDLWVSLPSGEIDKINAAYASDTKNASVIKSMAQQVTGLPVKYFVGIDFVGLQRMIGYVLGGIEVQVAETLDDPWYPIPGEEVNTCGMSAEEVAQVTAQYGGFNLEKQFPCRYEHLHYEPGLTKMEGGDVLKYVRSRHGSGAGDFSRSRRQHEVLEAVKQKLFSLEAAKNVPGFYKTAVQHVNTDIDLEVAKYIVPALRSSKDFEVCRVVLSTENVFVSGKNSRGQFILQPRSDWEGVRSFVESEMERCE